MTAVGSVVGTVTRSVVGVTESPEKPDVFSGKQILNDAVVYLTADGIVERGGNVTAMCNTKPSGGKFGQCIATTGSLFTTPSSPGADVTTNFEVRCRIKAAKWDLLSGLDTIFARYDYSSNKRTWAFSHDSGGTFSLQVSNNGTTSDVLVSDVVPLEDGVTYWLRAVFDNGTATFYYSADGTSAPDDVQWTSAGSDTSTITTVWASGSALSVGGRNAASPDQYLNGSAYCCQLLDGDGTIVADFNPNDYDDRGQSQWRSSQTGEVWTIEGDNYVVTPRVMVGTGEPWADLPGASGDYFSTPDSVANSFSQYLDICAEITLSDIAGGGEVQTICSKYEPTGDQRSYEFAVLDSSALFVQFSELGTGASTTGVTGEALPFSDSDRFWCRVTVDFDGGSGDTVIVFYTSTDGVTWTQLGDSHARTLPEIFDGNSELAVGARPGGSSRKLSGAIHRVMIYNEAESDTRTAAVDFDPIQHTHGGVFNSVTGEQWTANGAAAIHGYDMNVVVGTAANSKKSISDACLMFGASGDYVSTPNSAANSITGDIDIRCEVRLDKWSALGRAQMFSGKYDVSGDKSWLWYMNGSGADDGKMVLLTTANGSLVRTSKCTVVTGIPDGAKKHIRVTMDVDNDASGSTTTFYTSDDGVAWFQLGDPIVNAGATSIYDSAVALEVGAYDGGVSPVLGTIYKSEIYDGIDGTLAVSFDASDYVNKSSDTQFPSSATSEVWTLNGNTFIQNTGHDVVHTIGGAGLESTSGVTIGNNSSMFAVARYTSANPSTDQYLFDSRSSSADRWIVMANSADSDRFSFFQGTSILGLSEAFDTDTHVFSANFNGDATSKLEVSGTGETVRDVGSVEFDYMTLFAAFNGTNTLQGMMGAVAVFDTSLKDLRVQAVSRHLRREYSI